ncbi:hypothetical protein ZWY2020_036181 [Hordeum vulgare]|nr:hypothetical protein ZWY2020_036181 [Hordeum vulgare]
MMDGGRWEKSVCRSSQRAHFFLELRRHMNLISKVFSAHKMNHAKIQGGPRGLHTWRSGKGLGCYQGDPNGVLISVMELPRTSDFGAKMDGFNWVTHR